MTITKETRNTFFARLQGRMTEHDIMLVEFAYDLSKEAHRTQSRDGGERYFEHPRAGCLILMDELGIYDRDLLIAFLLHDAGEDTPILGNRRLSYEKFKNSLVVRLSPIFGEKVADTVLRLTKPGIDSDTFKTKGEMFQFYIERLKESEDTIILKMVDRLHNLRSLPITKPTWVKKQVDETEAVYFPIFASVKGEKKQYSDVLLSKMCFEIKDLKASLIG